MVASHIPLHFSIKVVDGFFSLTHIRNPGVAFGLFARNSAEYKTQIFIAISMVAIGAILVMFHQMPNYKKHAHISLILIFSGAIGNLIDRVIYKEVIDFLDFYFNGFHFLGFYVNGYHWPAFNVADSCITVGVIYMIYDVFQPENPESSISPSEN